MIKPILSIDKQKLEAHFQQLGKQDIPKFIDIYLKQNRSFSKMLKHYNSKDSTQELYKLVHKLRGSTANFFCGEFIAYLLEIEYKLQNSSVRLSKADIEDLENMYREFCNKLRELAKDYQPRER